MKMYCIFACESIEKMGGNRGKLAAQAGHAFVGAYQGAAVNFKRRLRDYGPETGEPKIVLVADTVDDLLSLRDAYVHKHPLCYVTDAARTVFVEPTVTCIAIGPISDDDVGADIKSLKVLL